MKQSGQVVLLPFPFTDLSATKLRPALILRKASREFGFSSILCGKPVHTVTGLWKGLAGRFESLPVVRKMMLVRLLSDLNPLALTMAA